MARHKTEELAGKMSRAALSKSRADKTRLPAVPVPHVVVEIVPGRFTEADWAAMVAEEEGEEIIAEIIDDLIARVMDGCYKVYLQRQLIPFTITQARDALVQIIEWRFLVSDEGERDISGGAIWQQDEEPQPCITDSWAQGSVPVIRSSLTPRTADIKVVPEESSKDVLKKEGAAEARTIEDTVNFSRENAQEDMKKALDSSQSQGPQLKEETRKEKKSTSLLRQQKSLHQPLPPPKEQKPKQNYKPHRGPLHSAGLKEITKSLVDTEKELFIKQLSQTVLIETKTVDLEKLKLLPLSCHNILKIQPGRPPQNKDVTFDEFGNITSVPKLDLCHLPKHQIRPHFEVLDPEVEAEHQRLEVIKAGGPILLRTGRSKNTISSKATKGKALGVRLNISELTGSLTNVPDQKFNREQSKSLNQGSSGVSATVVTQMRSGPDTLKSGILLESMNLAPGVALRENHVVKEDLWQDFGQEDNGIMESWDNLKPILTTVPRPQIMVEQLIKDHIPQVRPMDSFQPFQPSLMGQF